MHSLGGVALRGIRRRPLRNGLTVLGIALGVGLLFAALATDAGVEAAAERTIRETVSSADLAVRAAGAGGIAPAGQAAIAATEGIAEVSAEVRRRTFAVDLGRGLDEGMFGPVTAIGVDPPTTERFHDWSRCSAPRPGTSEATRSSSPRSLSSSGGSWSSTRSR